MDETFIDGKEKDKHEDKRSHTRGPSGKTVVVGMKDRETKKVIAKPVSERSKEEIHGLIGENVSPKQRFTLTIIEVISDFFMIMKPLITVLENMLESKPTLTE